MNGLTDQQIAQWYPPLFRTALRLTGSAHDAADLTQEAFCKAVEHWDSYDCRGQRTTWLYRILINCVRDWVRAKMRKRQQAFDEWELIPTDGKEAPGLDSLDRKEQHEALHKSIAGLSDTVRQAFIVTVIDGFSYQQASDILGVPVGTVASRVNSARGELFRTMRIAFPEAGQ